MQQLHRERQGIVTTPQYVITDAELHQPKRCTVDNCNRPHCARGFCGLHYQRMKRGAPMHDPPPPPDLPGETWRPVTTADSLYSVSNMGRIRRDVATNRAKAGRILKTPLIDGYAYVNLFDKAGKCRMCRVHRLVMEAFVGPARGRQVNHKDFDKANNRLSNLEYVTAKGNIRHALRGGRMPPQHGTNNPLAKLTDDRVLAMRRLYSTGRYRHADLAEMFGVSRSNVTMIVSGKAWRHVEGALFQEAV